MGKIDLEWKDVPEGWALCFNEGCALRETCLRWQVGLLAPDNLTLTRCVTPRALKDEQCRHFVAAEKVRFARGFSTIYDKVLKQHYTPLRKEMTTMLSGKRYYYEYKRGERPLSPQQQEAICQLFAQWGYDVAFDIYEEAYPFPWL